MIKIEGITFARTNGEFIDTLFSTGGTANGFYRYDDKAGLVRLYNMQHQLIGYLFEHGQVSKYSRPRPGRVILSPLTGDYRDEFEQIRDEFDSRMSCPADPQQAVNINEVGGV